MIWLMAFSSQRVQSKSKTSSTKVMSILGAFAACVFAITTPSVYYAITINDAQQALTIEAAFLAKSIEKNIQASPDLWEFESVRLKELILQPSTHENVHELEIRNAAGELVEKTDLTVSHPIISVSATFFDSGRLAGSIVVRQSIRTQIITTALIGIISSLLGCLFYFIFRTYPIRKLENTLIDLQRERDKSDKTLYAIGDGVISVDPKGKILLINRVAESLVGMDTSEAVGRQLEEVYVLRQGQENQVGEKGCILTSKGGNEYAIEEVRTPLTEMGSDESGVVIVFRDITERKQAEEALQRAHDELEQRVADRTEELMQVNEELRIEITEHKQAEDNIKQQTDATEAAIDGMALLNEDGKYIYLNKAHVKIYGYENAGELIGKSWRIIYDADEVKRVEAEIMPKLHQKGYWQGEALGMKKNGNKFPQELSLTALDSGGLICIVSDITDRKLAEQKLQDTLDSLRKAFSAIVQVMVSAVEIRDPYTAGHQMRSADLARAIAAEMNLSQDKIEAIRMACSIHDIGKLSIPAEILSKPKKLSEIEISLIKEHSRNGYEMLKDVESPWPLAEIVYQHHERMDGSGYPRNLKGEEILIEARILAVADVVGAMASHRPYRPALGLNAALAEIENNKGTLYDADAVDACLRLFREKGFQLEGT